MFRSMQQHSGERLSDFLRRLERMLTKVVQKGGLHPSRRDQARVEQLLRGTFESELMLVQLRLRERRHNPPTFLELLNEIREEEDHQLLRCKSAPSARKATVHQLNAMETTTSSTSETAYLQSEIDELKAQLSRFSTEKSSMRADPVQKEPMQSRGA